MLQVFQPGSKVSSAGLTMRLLAVMIGRGNAVSYQVGYLDSGNAWHEIWLPAEEVEPACDKLTIGFGREGE